MCLCVYDVHYSLFLGLCEVKVDIRYADTRFGDIVRIFAVSPLLTFLQRSELNISYQIGEARAICTSTFNSFQPI